MGCRANQFETAIIEENLNKNNHTKVNDIEHADIYILNSCSVTAKSDNEAFYHLRNAKHKKPGIKTVLTGCIAQIEKEKLLENDFIDIVIGNDEKLNINNYLNLENTVIAKDLAAYTEFNHIPLNDTSKTRASLKIQDGCDNRCTYCIIWKARGKSRSAKLEFIIEQINNFSKNGFKEIMLTGIHIGQWGKDFGLKLIDLLKEIEAKTTIERYRLGSLNPSEIDEELLNFLSKSDKFCPHFHLSLQSANDKVLKLMNRFYKTQDYLKQIDMINQKFDLPFIGSDIIAGFPQETDDDFEITKSNLEKSGLTQIHTFPYSVRPGTVGASMDNQVPDDIKNKRANIIKQISKDKLQNFILKNIGKIHEIIIEKHPDKQSGNLKGLTRNYLSVQIKSDRTDLFNTIVQVKLTKYENGIIYGAIV